MKKTLISFFTPDCDAFVVQSEKSARFTQYLADNPFVISPAYAGIGDNFRVRLNGLTQWVGIKDARKTNLCMLILGLQIGCGDFNLQ
jgi:hypothetical protein